MKILAITHLFPNEGNNNDGIFAARQLLEMRTQGADVTVLVPLVWCPAFLRNLERWRIYNHNWKCRYRGIEAVTVPYFRLPGKWYRPVAHRTLFYVLRNQVVRLHKAKSFDVIYARFLHPEGYAAMRLSKILRIPAVGVGAGDEVNVYPDESRIFKRDFIKIVNELDGIIASGPGVTRKIEAVSGKKAMAVHGVVDLKEFAPISDQKCVRKEIGLPLEKFIVLYAGTYKVAKGIFELIDAFERISKKVPDVILKVCGYGRQEARMRAVIDQRRLQQVIEVVGLIDPSQMHKWMQAADLFVLPSYEEGMPNAIMEAMACALPVVASSVGGLPGEIGDCKGAILIEPKSVGDLEQAMLKVTQNRQLREEMKIASRKRAEERFGVERNARTVLSYLQKVIEKTRAKQTQAYP